MKNFQQFDGAYGKFLKIKSGAGNQVRTGDLNLGKVALYQLSYSRFEFVNIHPRDVAFKRLLIAYFFNNLISVLT